MVNSKQLLVGFFTAVLLLTSCGGTAADTIVSDDSSIPDTTEELTGRDAVKSSLPENLDFNGETLTVLQRSADVAFLTAIPYAAGILLCGILAAIFRKKAK